MNHNVSQTEVRIYRVDYNCPNCGTPMEPARNSQVHSWPEKQQILLEHVCPRCNNRVMLDKFYPYHVYVDADEELSQSRELEPTEYDEWRDFDPDC